TIRHSHVTLKARNHITMGSAGSPTHIYSTIYVYGNNGSRSLQIEAGGNLSLINLVIEGVPTASFFADGNVWVSRVRVGAVKDWIDFFDDPEQTDFPEPTYNISLEAGRNVVISQSEFRFYNYP